MPKSPSILAIGTATPRNRYTQEEIYDLTRAHSPFYRNDAIRQIFMNSDISHRHLYLDLPDFRMDESVDELHERFRRGSMDIGSEAIRNCLKGRDVGEIDCVVAVSCTGYLCPGLSSLLVKEFDMKRSVQRADLLGMGCAGAMPGLQRAYDFVSAYPEKKALLLTVEICSACYYLDESLETVVGNAICGDGAAAVLIGMSETAGVPKIEGFSTFLEPSLIGAVGFEQREGKLRIILSKDIRSIAGGLAEKLIDNLLAEQHVEKTGIRHWILHSGGRKVIDGLQRAIGLTEEQVRHSKCVLREYGNMSSPTVLFVLKETMEKSNPRAGDLGVMVAMGPGLAIEGALLRWQGDE